MIETRDLTKMYGDLYALNRLTLKLEKGDVYGFIGPNGAGKTTTMRILATLLNPTWGEASVCGYSIYNNAKEIRRLMGYMPDFFGVYDDMKVIEYLEFFAAAYRIKGIARRRAWPPVPIWSSPDASPIQRCFSVLCCTHLAGRMMTTPSLPAARLPAICWNVPAN